MIKDLIEVIEKAGDELNKKRDEVCLNAYFDLEEDFNNLTKE